MVKIGRRAFMGSAMMAAVGCAVGGGRTGARFGGWKKGHFQIHFTYTGASESMFLIFPDGTTMLLDCGDFDAASRGELALPLLPDGSRHAGEWIARYVKRVNPNGSDVDYMLISHFHRDHMGSVKWCKDVVRRGNRDYHLTGFSLAAETLHFRTAIDRTGGAFDSRELFEPSENQFPYLLDCLYGYLKARDGLEVEKLRLGATGQIGGSSMLKLESGKVDLSRRQAVYRLLGMSFREYLAFEKVIDHRVIGFDELLSDLRRIASAVAEQTKILPHFERYQRIGFYPFYAESHAQYHDRLLATVRKVLEVDYPSIEDVSQETIRTTKKILKVLAASTPQTHNMSELYRQLGTERNQGLKMLNALNRAGLLALVPRRGAKLDNLSRPEKIYCDNTNLMYALVSQVNVGVRRETYFFNQARKGHEVCFSGVGDFEVDGKWVFEVGGKGKGFSQVKDLPNSYVVNDDTEVGIGNRIPLWLFGFMY